MPRFENKAALCWKRVRCTICKRIRSIKNVDEQYRCVECLRLLRAKQDGPQEESRGMEC